MTTILRPLSTSELLDRTFHLYRNNFLVFVGINAIPQLFMLPLTLGGAAMIARHQASAATAMVFSGYLLYFLAFFISQAPTVSAVSSLHFEKAITIGGAYASSRRSLLRVIWIVFLLFVIAGVLFFATGVLITLAIGLLGTANLGDWISGIGAIALVVIPAYVILRWMLGWSLMIPVTVLEGGWFLTSLRRSRFLAKDSRWRIFVLYFLMGLLGGVTSIMVESLMLMLVPVFGVDDSMGIQAVTTAMQAVGIFVSTTLVGALGTIAICLFYYDQRVRKEGLDLQLMIANLETAPQNPAAAPAL
jgi:hypothetical protein